MQQRGKIQKIQDIFVKSFIQHKQQHQAIDTPSVTTFNRILKIMLKLNILQSLESELVEDIFFINLIGPVQIDNVIPHILKLGGNGPNDV